jgi:flagellin
MRINHNIAALNTYRQLSSNQTNTSKSLEKLSSGLRINRAGDDAAGLAISEKMRGQIRGLDQASRNAQDGISMIQTAEGALSETHSILQRMRELAVQGATETLATEDRTAIGTELKELAVEIDRIANTTQFNGKKLLNGDLGGAKLDATGAIKIGTALATTVGAAVTAIDVSGAKSNETYTFTAGAGAKATTHLVLTRGSDSVSQEIALDATIDTDGDMSLNFGNLGISLTISGDAAKTRADIITDLSGAATLETLAGSASANFHIGSNQDETINVSFGAMKAEDLGKASDLKALVKDLNANLVIDTATKANVLIEEIDGAINKVSTQRSTFGAAQNRLEHTINNLGTTSENLTASESRIRDVDMAKEMMEFTKNNILSQAAQAMLAQANQQPQGVLQLLQ